MNLLVAATDPDLCRVLQTMLTQAGHDVRQAPDARAALAMHSALAADVLLVDQRLPDRSGVELIRQIRDREGPFRTVPALLLVDFPRPPLLDEVKSLQAVRVLAKPPSLLDLLDLLATLAPPRSAPPPPASPRPVAPRASVPLNLGNLRVLAGWWAAGATGVVRADLDGGTSVWVMLADGGPVGSDGLQSLLGALRGGRLVLEACEVDGVGDREALGNELWRSVRAWVADGDSPSDRMAIAASPHTASAQELPLAARVRGALATLEMPTSASALAERTGVPLNELVSDFQALAILGLLQVHIPRESARSGSSHSGSTRATGSPSDDTAGGATRPRSPASQPTRAPLPPSRVPPPPDRPFDSNPAPAARPSPDRPPHPPARPPDPADEDPPTAPAATATEIARQVLRLRRELRVLETADGWTVLGIPRGSAPEVVTHAVARMGARYQPLTLSAHQELRTLGKQMFARVQQAQSEIQRDGSASNPTEAQLVAAGRAMAERGNWDAADRRFSAARDESPSSALALAWLGWARFHNDTYDDELREDEGVAFVDLALAFDPHCVDALYLRAALAHAQKDVLVAWDMLDRLFRVQPAHPQARDLARQLGTRPPSS